MWGARWVAAHGRLPASEVVTNHSLEEAEQTQFQLSATDSKALRAALRPHLDGQDKAAVEDFLITAEFEVAHFCDFERRQTCQPQSKTARELRRLGQRIDSFRRALRHISDEALQETDLGCWPGNGMASEQWERHARHVAELAGAANLPAPPEGTLWSSYYRVTALIALDRMRTAIDFQLKPLPGISPSKGGAPRRLAWHHLAWRIALALERCCGKAPSATLGGHFEQVLSACLRLGLRVIGSRRKIPDDLRVYTRDALRSLKRGRERQIDILIGVKPRQK